MPRTSIDEAMLIAGLEFHLNYCFEGFIAPVEFMTSHQVISRSHRNDFSIFLLFLSQAFDFSIDKSLTQFLTFGSVFSHRFAPGWILVLSIAL
jgi:hypothetical protein